MKIEKNLYIKILKWAHERQEAGFSWKDLKDEFNLNHAQEQWALKTFRSNMPASDNLIDHLSYSGNNDEHLFYLTAKGISAAIEHLNLKEKSTRSINDKNINQESSILIRYWWVTLIVIIIGGVIVFMITEGKIPALFKTPPTAEETPTNTETLEIETNTGIVQTGDGNTATQITINEPKKPEIHLVDLNKGQYTDGQYYAQFKFELRISHGGDITTHTTPLLKEDSSLTCDTLIERPSSKIRTGSLISHTYDYIANCSSIEPLTYDEAVSSFELRYSDKH